MKTLIDNYAFSNSDELDALKERISLNIDGRICHHRVVILNILCKLTDVRTYLEIGVHNGASMSYVVSQDTPVKCIGVDLFESTTQQYKKDSLLANRTYENINKNNKAKSSIQLIKGNSQTETTFSEVELAVGEDLVDLLFIDGDHSYDGIKSDFDNYARFVKKGGFVVIDDYNKRWPDIIKFCDNEINKTLFRKIGLFYDNELVLQKI